MLNTKCNISLPLVVYLFLGFLGGNWMCHYWLFYELNMEHSINMQTVLFSIVYWKSLLE